MKAINIKWDADYKYQLEDLPTEIEISDYISDEVGFCHYGFELID